MSRSEVLIFFSYTCTGFVFLKDFSFSAVFLQLLYSSINSFTVIDSSKGLSFYLPVVILLLHHILNYKILISSKYEA